MPPGPVMTAIGTGPEPSADSLAAHGTAASRRSAASRPVKSAMSGGSWRGGPLGSPPVNDSSLVIATPFTMTVGYNDPGSDIVHLNDAPMVRADHPHGGCGASQRCPIIAMGNARQRPGVTGYQSGIGSSGRSGIAQVRDSRAGPRLSRGRRSADRRVQAAHAPRDPAPELEPPRAHRPPDRQAVAGAGAGERQEPRPGLRVGPPPRARRVRARRLPPPHQPVRLPAPAGARPARRAPLRAAGGGLAGRARGARAAPRRRPPPGGDDAVARPRPDRRQPRHAAGGGGPAGRGQGGGPGGPPRA